jgi:hypothetical protein
VCRPSTWAPCALLLSACAAAPGGGAPARLALVIGNAAYEGVPALAQLLPGISKAYAGTR